MPTSFWQGQYREMAARGKKPARREKTFAEIQAEDAEIAAEVREGVDFSRKDFLLKRVEDGDITDDEIQEIVSLHSAGGFSPSESETIFDKMAEIRDARHARVLDKDADEKALRESDLPILTKETVEEPLKPSETVKIKGNEDMASLEGLRRRRRELG
jgi:hypothetical protein